MALDSKHPQYSEFLEDWETMRHCYRGERVVKEQTVRYLPATSGMLADGMLQNQPGYNAYRSYITRAVYHNFVRWAVVTLLGIMHRKPPTIELPARMEPMRQRATVKGESLQVLLRKINEAQLTTGRIGLLLDLAAAPTSAEVLPYIAPYRAEDIINWDDGRRDELTLQQLNLVVLNESEQERKLDFSWELRNKYRVLVLGAPDANEPTGVYRQGVFRTGQGEAGSTFNEAGLAAPAIRGKTLDRIPFQFINSQDVVPEPDDPPLLALAKLSLAIYRGEADYRQSLFMQGQDTLVVIGSGNGEDDNVEGGARRVGAGAALYLPSENADAKYIGVGSEGLSEQREALENDKKAAQSMGAQLIDTTSREKESGEALRTRVGAQTATLNQMVLSGAYGLEQTLRTAATWLGLDPEQVKVEPNLDFEDMPIDGKTLVEFMSAKNMGAPLSRETIHLEMQRRGLTKFSLEEEMERILDEEPLTIGITEPTNPDADPDEEDTE